MLGILDLFIIVYSVVLFLFMFIVIFMLYSIAKGNNKENIKQNARKIRKHEKITRISFGSALDPYERYVDKSTKLYEPRKQGGGVRIEVDK